MVDQRREEVTLTVQQFVTGTENVLKKNVRKHHNQSC